MYGSAGLVSLEPRLERLSFLSFFLRFRFGRLLLAFAAAGDGMRVKAAARTATPQVAAAATITCALAESWRTMSERVVVQGLLPHGSAGKLAQS